MWVDIGLGKCTASSCGIMGKEVCLQSLVKARRHLIYVDKYRFFFEHYGVNERDLERYLGAALSAGGDYADLYFEYLSSRALMVDASIVKSAFPGISAR